ncbi:MAG: hypothetical protein AB7H97_13000 [Pseudobdellovibrionaceae bacterium]
MMIRSVQILLFGSIFLNLCLASADVGNSDGGGGVGVQCVTSPGQTSLEVLDLHEAKLNNIPITHQPQNEEESIALSTSLLARHYWNRYTIPVPEYEARLREYFFEPFYHGGTLFKGTEYETKIKYVSDHPLMDDLGEYTIAPGCELTQIVYWSDEKKEISIVKSKWDRLDGLNKAALVNHEIFYFFARHQGFDQKNVVLASMNQEALHPMTSQESRRAIGLLFSVDGLTPKGAGVPPEFVSCVSDDLDEDELNVSAFTFSEGPDDVTMVFTVLQNKISIYQMKAKFQIEMKELMQVEGNFHTYGTLELPGSSAEPDRYEITLRKDKGTRAQLSLRDRDTEQEIGVPHDLICEEY